LTRACRGRRKSPHRLWTFSLHGPPIVDVVWLATTFPPARLRIDRPRRPFSRKFSFFDSLPWLPVAVAAAQHGARPALMVQVMSSQAPRPLPTFLRRGVHVPGSVVCHLRNRSVSRVARNGRGVLSGPPAGFLAGAAKTGGINHARAPSDRRPLGAGGGDGRVGGVHDLPRGTGL